VNSLRINHVFYWTLGITLVIRLWLAGAIPLTGDEAYFFIWGKYPDYGYYDHPPMVGWLISVLLLFGDARWLLRLPAILLVAGIAIYIVHWLRPRLGESKAYLAALFFLLAPLNVSNLFITTDTPLVIFSFIAAVLFLRALEENTYSWWFASGIALGLAFLSKYFAVLLGITFAAYVLIYRRNRRDLPGLFVLFLGVLPSAALNLWWNYNHCWDNILFNLINRHDGSESGQSYVGTYLLMVVYLLMPPLLWYAWKQRMVLREMLSKGDGYLFLWLAPMTLFLFLAFYARIGLHWVLAFYPFMFIAAAMLLDMRQLRVATWFALGLSLLHVIGLTSLLWFAPDITQGRKVAHHDVVFGLNISEFSGQIDAATQGYSLATESYTYSAMLEHASGKRYAVMGNASKYGRQDDVITDWRTLNGKDVAVLIYKQTSIPYYSRFFSSFDVREITVGDVTDYLLLGRGFDYAHYRQTILTEIKQRFYSCPEYLVCQQCYFNERYFSGEMSVRSKVGE